MASPTAQNQNVLVVERERRKPGFDLEILGPIFVDIGDVMKCRTVIAWKSALEGVLSNDMEKAFLIHRGCEVAGSVGQVQADQRIGVFTDDLGAVNRGNKDTSGLEHPSK